MAFWLESKLFDTAVLEAVRYFSAAHGARVHPVRAETCRILRKSGHICEFQLLPDEAHVLESLGRLVRKGSVRIHHYVSVEDSDRQSDVFRFSAD
jgi:hypothetical protein